MINNYNDFCAELLKCGFSLGGGNDKGIFALIPYNWLQQEFVDTPVKWHTGDPDTDPWEWRMRVLQERDDIAYSKVFFRNSGYITKQWYPYFLACRRNGRSFEQDYADGKFNSTARRIYEIVANNCPVAFHEIKAIGGFFKEESAAFEKAIVDLQSAMYITFCGRKRKTNKQGEAYGWSSTVFMTIEDFWQTRGVDLPVIDAVTAEQAIRAQVLKLNPDAKAKEITKFIYGK